MQSPAISDDGTPAFSQPRRVAIQRNPKSGTGRSRHQLHELLHELRRLGFQPRLFKHRDKLDRWMAVPEHRTGLAGLVSAGGDGTVADLFNRFPGVPLAILPLGTENLLARFLGIPRSGRAVAQLIAAGGKRRLDLCRLRERRFAVVASAGFDADVVHRTHRIRCGNISRLSYLQPILESLRRYTYPELRIRTDGADAPITGRLALVINIPAYALRLPVAAAAREDDGLCDLRVFRRGSAFQMLRYLYKVARGSHERLSDVSVAQSRRFTIESDVPVPVQVDGDPAGWTPAEIEVLPGELEVFAPPPV
jgi:diacylglycerol kinase (ATP)